MSLGQACRLASGNWIVVASAKPVLDDITVLFFGRVADLVVRPAFAMMSGYYTLQMF